MKRLIINVFAFSIILSFSSGIMAQTKVDLQDQVAKMNKEMIEIAKAGRYEALDKFYAEDILYLPNNRVYEKGYKQVLTLNLQKKNGGYKVIDCQKTTLDLFVNGDLMVDAGTYTLAVTYPGPKEPVKDSGKYITVWKMDKEGNWKIVAETWNTDKTNTMNQASTQESEPAPAVFPNTNKGNTGSEQPVMDTKDGKK
jgi:ketosteroid isomerase-like protein